MFKNKAVLCSDKWNSVAQSSEQAPFTSENVGWILATDSFEESANALAKVVGFLRVLRFPPTGKVGRVG